MHPDVKRLWAMYENTVTSPSVKTRTQFGTFLSIVLSSYETSGGWDTVSQTQLAELWLLRTRQHLKDTTCSFIPMTTISRFLLLLQSEDVCRAITANTLNLPLLACALVQGACEQRSAVPENAKKEVLLVLHTWLNAQHAPTQVTTSNAVCDILYGPGVWDLYRPDVDDDNLLPVHLYRNQIPLRLQLLDTEHTTRSSVQLPGNVA